MNLSDEIITQSPEATFAVAQQIGEQLTGGAVFLLRGDLGAGKTVFAKGLAAGLGIDPVDVTSPTFTLVNEYEGRLRLYHIDLYRLEVGACFGLGLEDLLEEKNAVVLIEWAERLGFVPAGATLINIEYRDDSERRITITERK
ncbi:MAG: tRNA (adenosine(37)-N6)-threonylcarbamoyltransferase complex ATPase subunit type 1 TsaE [Acidobacteria bacterium]|nr:tRNA (adenosine(37)-N6)-threonylcarbamoyltransferase complex ATPase subunit type 1 TsaE [Acidobacteriota bacterium]